MKDMIVTYNHEMNQPLTAIQGYADLLLSDVEEGDENYDTYKTILDQAERVITILNKIKSLETSDKIEKKQYIPGSTMIDLNIDEQSGE
jgi:signal transduction histidine kinase